MKYNQVCLPEVRPNDVIATYGGDILGHVVGLRYDGVEIQRMDGSLVTQPYGAHWEYLQIADSKATALYWDTRKLVALPTVEDTVEKYGGYLLVRSEGKTKYGVAKLSRHPRNSDAPEAITSFSNHFYLELVKNCNYTLLGALQQLKNLLEKTANGDNTPQLPVSMPNSNSSKPKKAIQSRVKT